MTAQDLSSKIGMLTLAFAMTACVSAVPRYDVPNTVLQHALESLTREQSFTWATASGQTQVIRPLGTFKSGETYCRDYRVSSESVADQAETRTACRIDGHWTDVDASELEL